MIRRGAVVVSVLLVVALAQAPPSAARARSAARGVAAPTAAVLVSDPLDDADHAGAGERRKKKRARISASSRRIADGRLVVTVRSNARKVRVTYRLPRHRHRAVTLRVRKKQAQTLLPQRATRVRARAKATHRLRASRRVSPRFVRAPHVWLADVDGDGIRDYVFDREADGRIDAVLFDDDRNGRYERLAVFGGRATVLAWDQDQNGYYETAIVDRERKRAGRVDALRRRPGPLPRVAVPGLRR